MTFVEFAAYAGLALGVLNGLKTTLEIWAKKNERQRKLREELFQILLAIHAETSKQQFGYTNLMKPTATALQDGIAALKRHALLGPKSPSKKHIDMLLEILEKANYQWGVWYLELLEADDRVRDLPVTLTRVELANILDVVAHNVSENTARYLSALARIEDQQVFQFAYLRYRFGRPTIALVAGDGRTTTERYTPKVTPEGF